MIGFSNGFCPCVEKVLPLVPCPFKHDFSKNLQEKYLIGYFPHSLLNIWYIFVISTTAGWKPRCSQILLFEWALLSQKTKQNHVYFIKKKKITIFFLPLRKNMVLIIRVSVKICDQYRLLFFLLSFLYLYFLSLSSFPHSLLPSILPFRFSPFFFFFRVLAWELLWQKSVFLGFIFSEIKTLCLRQYSVCQSIYSFLQPMFVSNFFLCDWLLSHFTIFFFEVLVTILYQQSILFIFGLHEFYYNAFGHNFIWVYSVRCFQSFLNL